MTTTRFKPNNKVAFDKTAVMFKVLPGIRDKLKNIPKWQDKLRDFVDDLIKDFDGEE